MKYISTFFLLILLLIHLFVNYYNQTYILTDNLYRLIIGAQMSEHQFNDYMNFVHKWKWLSYLFIPFVLLLRISFVLLCLKIGSFVTEQYTQIPFWKICI